MQSEEQASVAFSKQAQQFDQLNASNHISQYLRDMFRREVLREAKPRSRMLELNCGTGMDAMFLASHGHRILATDVSPGMLAEFGRKLDGSSLRALIEVRQLSFEKLDLLQGRKFDHIISNFGGLNCSPDLAMVLAQMAALLDKGGKITLMVMPRVCPWELIMVLKGKFSVAFRRLKGHASARVEGEALTCYYYNPGYISSALGKGFRRKTLKGVCITVPPEFYLGFAERYPRLFSFLKGIDALIGNRAPFNRCCDHYLITLEKK
jgi:ubiquinone/menaquinone biosynthesis C-methylase UbiE